MGQEFGRVLEVGLLSGEAGLAELQRVPVDDDRGQQVKAGDPGVLAFPGPVAQFAALVEVDGALESMVRLALVQSDLGTPAHVGVRDPVDYEQRAFDAADFPQGGRQFVLAGAWEGASSSRANLDERGRSRRQGGLVPPVSHVALRSRGPRGDLNGHGNGGQSSRR